MTMGASVFLPRPIPGPWPASNIHHWHSTRVLRWQISLRYGRFDITLNRVLERSMNGKNRGYQKTFWLPRPDVTFPTRQHTYPPSPSSSPSFLSNDFRRASKCGFVPEYFVPHCRLTCFLFRSLQDLLSEYHGGPKLLSLLERLHSM